MIDGRYNSSLKTPMGEIKGVITLKSDGQNLSGMIETMGMKNEFSGGKVYGNNECVFSGEAKTPIGNLKYNINAVVNGNNLKVNAQTNMGNFEINGIRQM